MIGSFDGRAPICGPAGRAERRQSRPGFPVVATGILLFSGGNAPAGASSRPDRDGTADGSPQGAHRMLDGPAPVLEVSDLRTVFATRDGAVHAVNGVSFSIGRGRAPRGRRRERLGQVGDDDVADGPAAEPAGEITGGSILYQGREVRDMTPRQLRHLRGGEIGFVFQDPMTSLNPVFTVGYQLVEPIRVHMGLSKAAARTRAAELLALVGIPDAERAARRLSAPVLGRHAPAGDDRDGALLRPEAPDRRRADDGARRDDPGADPRDRPRAAPPARHGDRLDHPRPRPRRRHRRPGDGDVRGPGGRARARSRRSSPTRSTPTPARSSARCRA